MWKNLLTSATGLASGIYIYLIVAALSGAIVGYGAYSWTSDYYEAKISHANLAAEKEKNDIQAKGDRLVAQYIQQIDKLSANNASLQRQVPLGVRLDNGDTCVVSNGFVRLYNASAGNQASGPSRTDGSPSGLDAATILSTAIENNEKYNRLATQLIQLQAFENAK